MNTGSIIIIAIASPPGRSGRGIVRMSGEGLFDLLADVLRTTRDRPIPRARALQRAKIVFLGFQLPVLAMLFPGPNAYTGEDAAEMQLPGNPVLLERVVQMLIELGRRHSLDVRRAEPGEFTARAFFNGRLTLTEAEGVSATITAQSDAELQAAELLRHGALGALALQSAEKLAGALALVEASIDFTDEEDVVAISPGDLLQRLQSIRARLAQQLERAVGMEQLEAIPWVVLTGEPNAGKSTLFNALLGRERAVVADLAGTTRDVITEPLHVKTPHGEAEVMLVDRAGLDDDQTELNQHMQRIAREATDRAELVLQCVPVESAARRNTNKSNSQQVNISTDEMTGNRRSVLRPGRWLVRTKADLVDADHATSAGSDAIIVSAVTGTGLDDLRAMIARHLADRAVSLSADAMALTARHESELRAVCEALQDAIELIGPHRAERHLPEPELAASSMRTALDHLGALAGRITPDDVLGRIFGSFCIGK